MDVQALNSSLSYNPNSLNLNIISYGLGELGQSNSILFLSQNQILFPIGPNIGQLDLQNRNRTNLVLANTDSILFMLETVMFIVSITSNGQVSILNKSDLIILRRFQTECKVVLHAFVNKRYLSIVCEEKMNKQGVLKVYSIQKLLKYREQESKTSLHFIMQGAYKYAYLTENNYLITFIQNTIEDQQLIVSETKNHQAKKHTYLVQQYNLSLKKLTKSLDLPHESDIFQTNFDGKMFGVYHYSSRHILVLNLQSLKIISFSLINGSSELIKASTFIDKTTFVLSPANNYLLYVDCMELQYNPLPSQIEGNKEGKFESYEIRLFNSSAVSPSQYFLKIMKGFIFSANEEGFIYQNMTNPKDQRSFSSIQITATNIATNPDASLMAVSDITGNVLVYSVDQYANNQPVYKLSIDSGIRSLDWHPSGQSILIGTMGGVIYRWYYNDQSQLQFVAQLEGTITTLRFKDQQEKILLLATTTQGQFAKFEDKHSQFMQTDILAYGHLPKESSQQFGSLNLIAEIWGSAWNSNGTNMVATSSEDQSIHIFDLSHKQPALIHELTGHQLAVTAIDWKRMNDKLGDVFISCSDDKTVRVYDPQNNFELIHVFSTAFVKEWHTLTYLSLEEGGSRVAIGAQNGYLFIYDLVIKKFVFAQRTHNGGIEGLIWKNNRIFTCSNDCTVNVAKI